MEITTVIGCPIDCYYCPQDKLKIAYGNRPRIMTFEDFQFCIDKLPSTVTIYFSSIAEPWLNPQCTDMVLYASGKGHPLAIYTTLVGMNKQDWKRIKSLSYQIFNIYVADALNKSHIPVNPTYKKLW